MQEQDTLGNIYSVSYSDVTVVSVREKFAEGTPDEPVPTVTATVAREGMQRKTLGAHRARVHVAGYEAGDTYHQVPEKQVLVVSGGSLDGQVLADIKATFSDVGNPANSKSASYTVQIDPGATTVDLDVPVIDPTGNP
ncbi:hypothetical protein ACIQM4_27935 [Streptomyces sp. NPDC091272]|uniref:hypothetical protein n=1 Tax=Streptomyces sp. NPDC091272 TaxID=3365981 RepID=UPI0037FC9371